LNVFSSNIATIGALISVVEILREGRSEHEDMWGEEDMLNGDV